MKIAVVILNWNGVNLLKQFLPSVIAYSKEATIYVADNASTDQSIKVIKEEFPEVNIIQNNDNYGFAKGYNEALKNVNEPYLALINSDIEVTKNWLTPIIETFDNNTDVAIIQGKLLDYKNKTHFEYAGGAGGFMDKYGYPFCRGRIFDSVEEDLGQYNDIIDLHWATGACFFVRNNVFKELKGFDDEFFAHQEEIDLCWRAINLGFKIQYIPTCITYHVGGATLNESNPKKTYLNFRNSLFMLIKNLPINQLIPILFIRLILDGIASFQLLARGKVSHFWAVFRAHLSFYSHLKTFYNKRTTKQKKDYYVVKSIVYQYFIKKKDKFSDLL